jgi:hypothetical protein
MSLTATPVSQSDLTQLQAGVQAFTDATAAGSVAQQITNGTPGVSVFSYATQLFNAQTAGTQIAMGVDALIQGGVPTAGALVTPFDPVKNELQNASQNPGAIPSFLAAGTKNGVPDTTVFAAEAFAVSLASGGDGTQNNFVKNFGSLSEAQMAATISTQTGVGVAFVTTFIDNWLAFYNGAGKSAILPNLTATTQSYAAAFGDAIGNDIQAVAKGVTGISDTSKAFVSQIFNALVDNAENIAGIGGGKQYLPGTALANQPAHVPLQGEGAGGATVVLTTNPDTVGPNQNPPFKTIPGANNFINAPLIGAGTLQTADAIDGSVGGTNTIGKFGTPGFFQDGATPIVTDIQQIFAEASVAAGGTLNFANISQGAGQLQLAAIAGNFAATDNTTTFTNIKIGTPIGVENFFGGTGGASKTATFVFSGVTGVETADLTVNQAGVFTNLENTGTAQNQADIVINKIGTLNMHVTGASGIDSLRSDTLTTLNVDGSGNLRLDVAGIAASPALKTVDASGLKGVFNYDGDSTTQAGITIKVGSGGSNVGTDGNSAERIFFDAAKAVGDQWTPEHFNNLVGLTAGQIAATGSLDNGSVQITNFQAGGLDKIDLTQLTPPPATAAPQPAATIHVATPAENAVAEGAATLQLAAQSIPATASKVYVFTYGANAAAGLNGVDSTYVWYDQNANHTVDSADGFLKLVGVGGNSVQINSFV